MIRDAEGSDEESESDGGPEKRDVCGERVARQRD
jgi:hypothetical protein